MRAQMPPVCNMISAISTKEEKIKGAMMLYMHNGTEYLQKGEKCIVK